jgi:predicted nucleic acid-binding protein
MWKLHLAAGLGVERVPIDELWHAALEIAIAEDHPVYDTLFVALARRLGAPQVTYDEAVLRKFSDVARRGEDLLEV